MKTITDKIVKETVNLRDCKPGDRLYVRGCSEWETYRKELNLGNIIVVKVKLISKNRLQIKYKDTSLKAVVRKTNVPDNLTGVRTRNADRQDHETDAPHDAIALVSDVYPEVENESVDRVVILDPLPQVEKKSTKREPQGRMYDSFPNIDFNPIFGEMMIDSVIQSGGHLRRVK